MKKYIKNTNLVPIDNKIKIFSQLSNVPLDLDNEVVLVEGQGIYQCNNSTITKIYNDGRNISDAILGEIRMFYGNIIPSGWLELNGSTFDVNAFPLLYNLLGTNIVPDYREMALRGGTPVGVFSNDAMGSHSHTVNGTGNHTHCLPTDVTHFHCICNVPCLPYDYPCWGAGGLYRAKPAYNCYDTCYTCGCKVSASVIDGVSGITVGNSSWDSTITRAREVGVRYIIFAGE